MPLDRFRFADIASLLEQARVDDPAPRAYLRRCFGVKAGSARP